MNVQSNPKILQEACTNHICSIPRLGGTPGNQTFCGPKLLDYPARMAADGPLPLGQVLHTSCTSDSALPSFWSNSEHFLRAEQKLSSSFSPLPAITLYVKSFCKVIHGFYCPNAFTISWIQSSSSRRTFYRWWLSGHVFLAQAEDRYAACLFSNWAFTQRQGDCRYVQLWTCDDCAAAYKRWLCGTIFQRCANGDPNTRVRMCRDTCFVSPN